MRFSTLSYRLYPVALAALLATAVVLVGCGGSSTSSTSQQIPAGPAVTGTVTTSISDPPVCKGINAPTEMKFDNVWVTVTLVRAHISENAEDGSNGWQTLAELDPPLQIDLLNLGNGGAAECALAELGIIDQLPAGMYGQIRIHLLANNATEGPAENACASVNGWNCAQESGGDLKLLNLSSQANTGIKIPPGQFPDGPLNLEEGQAANINIEFNACRSIVEEGNGQLRLKPTLHAGEIGVVDTLSGSLVKVVGEGEAATTEPFTDVTGLVFLENVDENGIGRVMMELQTDADGGFNLCPVPDGQFDIVAAAMDSSGVTYNATVTLGVSAGAAVGEIPMVPETGASTEPGTIEGEVSTQDTGGNASTAEVRLFPLQDVSSDGSMLMTIPTFGDSTLLFTTVPDGTMVQVGDGMVTITCTDAVTTNCFNYTLMVPASDPQVGTFSAGGTTYAPANGTPEVEYFVLAEAFVPETEGQQVNCDPSFLTADEDNVTPTPNPLAVIAGDTVTAELLAFVLCQVDPAP